MTSSSKTMQSLQLILRELLAPEFKALLRQKQNAERRVWEQSVFPRLAGHTTDGIIPRKKSNNSSAISPRSTASLPTFRLVSLGVSRALTNLARTNLQRHLVYSSICPLPGQTLPPENNE